MAEQAHVKVGGALKEIVAGHVKISGALRRIINCYVKIGGILRRCYSGAGYQATMTTGQGVTPAYIGFIGPDLGTAIGSMSSTVMPAATLRGLAVDTGTGQVLLAIGGGQGPSGSFTDPGAAYLSTVQVAGFAALTVGGANYLGTGYAAGEYRSWAWSSSGDQDWLASTSYVVTVA